MDHPDPHTALTHVLEHVAHVLPSQGPIGVFIHHNTLHAFEDERFEDAVVHAGRRFGCQPFLGEEVYREGLRRGRISAGDVDAVVAAALGERAKEPTLAGVPRGDLWGRLIVHGIPDARGPALAWLLGETDVLDEPAATELWNACLETVGRASAASTGPASSSGAARRRRHRDLLVATHGIDPDEWTRPVQIRFVGAYLDQGYAHWPMPGRERGMLACFRELFGGTAARALGPWAARLGAILAEDHAEGRDDGPRSLAHSLAELGVPRDEWTSFLVDEALWLRGWAGMVRHLETRPDRAPAIAVPARLVDHLAIQMLLARAALEHAMRAAGIEGPLSALRDTLASNLPPPAQPTPADRAWPLFHAAKLCGATAPQLASLPAAGVAKLERDVAEIDGGARRRLLHLAYERQLRHRFYDALVGHPPAPRPEKPAFQVITCLDEREESIRRHIEEVEPRAETFGAAGFFGVAMYYRGAHAAHARPLCPVAITPERYVVEADAGDAGARARLRDARRALAANVDKNIHLGSRTFVGGAIITALLGALWMIPLVLRVLFPLSRRGMSQLRGVLADRATTRLKIDRVDAIPPLGKYTGFTVDEMADVVRGQLGPLGVVGRLAPIVLVLGHGSTSLNNPQESAHDCGACGGGRGGPSARAFAQMANDPRVRAHLAELGMRIPDGTWFVGGQRNSANNDVDLYDEDLVPERLRADLDRAKRAIEIARRREAHERCRRFESAPPHWFPEGAALLHVQARSTDLAQPRPEYGHASNAVCVIGRRARTRGLFLDRRAFLVSYDPTHDADGATLARLLAAVIPVLVGINLEYFFGYVDPTGYGCGTKLPHNVTALLGVMDGAQSDLRTGLPWQMLEIHEPVRLALAVEAKPETVRRMLAQDETLARLVRGGWLYLAALHPDDARLFEVDHTGAHSYTAERNLPVVRGFSRAHYAGRSEHLPFVEIDVTGTGGA